jgi:hypothetical protein
MNVGLRPFVEADVDGLDGWLAAVARSVGHDALNRSDAARSLLGRPRAEKSLRVRVIERNGDAAGLLVYRLHAPRRGAALIELVATPPSMARRGSGMTAVVVLEDELRAANVRAVYAPAPAIHGIAMYFWIRLGYRPLLSPDWPCRSPGVAWLLREL